MNRWNLAALPLCMLPLAASAQTPPTPQHRTIGYDTPQGPVKLTVLDQGKGTAVVMIPSLGRGAADFDDLAARLQAAGYRVLRIQPRGIDGSTGPMTGISMHSIADDIAQVIQQSTAGKAFVLGHDDGNRFARATAAYYPDLVKAVVLLNAGGKAKPDPEAIAALTACFDPSLPANEHLAAVQTGFFAPGNDASVWAGGWYPKAALMERAAVTATPLAEWWTAGSAPVLVIQGDQDRIAPKENVALLKADIGDRAEIHHIDHAGHALLPEQPEQVAAIILAYLKLQQVPMP